MAIHQSTVWEMRVAGNASNGGGFADLSPGTSVDWSQSSAPHEILTKNLTTSGAGITLLECSAANWTTGHVGNCICITGGTNFVPGIYQITAYVSATAVVLDHSPTPSGAGSAGTGRIGGAQSDPQAVADAHQAGNRVWVRAGTYSTTSAILLPDSIGTASAKIRWTGYSTTRGDGVGCEAYFDRGNGSSNILTIGTSSSLYGHYIIEYLGFKNSQGSYSAIHGNSRNNLFYRCGVYDVGYNGIYAYNWGNMCIGCEIKNHGLNGATSYGIRSYLNGLVSDCYVWRDVPAQAASGFHSTSYSACTRCIASKTYRGFYNYLNNSGYQAMQHTCIAFGCAQDGFYGHGNGPGQVNMINCMAINNGGYGLNDAFSPGVTINAGNFAHYGNGSGGIDTLGLSTIVHAGDLDDESVIALTEQPFIDPDNHDFRIKPHLVGLLRAGLLPNLMIDGEASSIPVSMDHSPMQTPWYPRRT